MEKQKKQIFLIGSDLNRSQKIGICLIGRLSLPPDLELETVSIQTEKDYRLLVTQGWRARPAPLAVLVDTYVVTDKGGLTFTDGLIYNLREELGYIGIGPIIACAEQPVRNDRLYTVGATHRVGSPAPKKGLGTPVTIEEVIEQATGIIYQFLK